MCEVVGWITALRYVVCHCVVCCYRVPLVAGSIGSYRMTIDLMCLSDGCNQVRHRWDMAGRGETQAVADEMKASG